VVLALALLVVGGVALWGALTSEPAAPSPGSTRAEPPASTEAAPSSRQPQSATTSRTNEALVVRCRVARCGVFISAIPGNEVLFNGNLGQGETRQADEPRMNLVVSDGSAVDVFINGKLQAKGAAGKSKTFTIVKS
jgi:hypothetical protein